MSKRRMWKALMKTIKRMKQKNTEKGTRSSITKTTMQRKKQKRKEIAKAGKEATIQRSLQFWKKNSAMEPYMAEYRTRLPAVFLPFAF